MTDNVKQSKMYRQNLANPLNLALKLELAKHPTRKRMIKYIIYCDLHKNLFRFIK